MVGPGAHFPFWDLPWVAVLQMELELAGTPFCVFYNTFTALGVRVKSLQRAFPYSEG